MKNIAQSLKIIVLAIVLSFGISYVYAWTAPTQSPPAGNVSAPINTSGTGQYKVGSVGFGGLIRGYSNAIFDGKVGIGTTDPYRELVVYGSSADGSAVAVDRPAGLAGMYQVRTNGLARWVFGGSASPESGSNAGTDFQIISYNDAGLGEANAVTIKRSNGNVGIGTGASDPTQKLDVAGNIKATDVCTTAGKCLSTATTGASGGTFKTAQDYINAYSGKVATIPAKLVASNTAWVNLLAYTFDNVYTSGSYYCYTLNGSSGCQSYAADQAIKFGSDGYIYVDSVPALNNEYGYWGLYEVVPANRVNNIQLCYYATPSLNTTGNGSCSFAAAAPRYASGYKLAIGGWLGATTAVNISYSLNGVTVSGGSYPATTAMFP